jgi:serpin B
MGKDMIMHRFLGWAVALLAVTLSCSKTPDIQDPEDGLPPFPKAEHEIAAVPLTRAEQTFVQAGNEFAWKLTKKVWESGEKKSLIISPLSVQYALGMLGNGADAAVAARIADVLGYEGKDAINGFCAKLIETLPQVDTSVTLALADGVLVNDRFTPKAPFKSAVETYYDALVESMSFADDKAVMKYVNDWCEKHTYGRIKDVLKEVDPAAVMYLMNAIFFHANWTSAFDKAATRNENFRNLAGTTAKVGMMHQTLDASYGENDFCQAVSLPYGNGKFALTVYLPKKSDGLMAVPEAKQLPWMSETCHVILSLPRFETETTVEMKDLLAGMGLPVGPYTELVENDSADISRVIHKANITVNETGTEAAAVTVIEMKYTSAGPSTDPRTVTFTADHPFLYTISERTSGVILFTGLYNG